MIIIAFNIGRQMLSNAIEIFLEIVYRIILKFFSIPEKQYSISLLLEIRNLGGIGIHRISYQNL